MCLNILKEANDLNTSNITNYKPKDFAELSGVSVKILQRWDREGI
jgi:DNA-binding transcriptional regulator YiaG